MRDSGGVRQDELLPQFLATLMPLAVFGFYSASALLAMQSAVFYPSVRLSICLSVRHVPVLCPDE